MVKFMILFHKPQDEAAFERSYNDFLALIERMPAIQRRQVVSVLGSPVGAAHYHRILEVYFEDMAQLEASLQSKAGQEAGSELGRRFRANTYETLFADVYEEVGGRTENQT